MEEDHLLDPALFKDYEHKDLIMFEKNKLLESALYSKVMASIDQSEANEDFELVLECNQLLTKLDQLYPPFTQRPHDPQLPALRLRQKVPRARVPRHAALRLREGGQSRRNGVRNRPLPQNKSDLVLNDILSSHLVVAVKIALNQTKNKELNNNDRSNTIKAADFLVFLEAEKNRVIVG